MNPFRLESGTFSLGCNTANTGVLAAAHDLTRDFEKVLGTAPSLTQGDAAISLVLDPTLPAETFSIVVDDKVSIRGGDELGVIYGIYEFSHRFMGVEPFWFWKDLEPERRDYIEVPRGEYFCKQPVFRFRGWFINDEDLLVGWKEPSGRRFQEWPPRDEVLNEPPAPGGLVSSHRKLLEYYSDIPNLDTMEMVYEAALRLRANLIIPASFIDIMNEPEAELIRRAARRGLYVSQHHIEPLGVSFFN